MSELAEMNEISILRAGMKKMINNALKKCGGYKINDTVDYIEKHIFEYAHSDPEQNAIQVYGKLINATINTIPTQIGPFPKDIAGPMLIERSIDVQYFIQYLLEPPIVTQREVIRRKFISNLYKSSEWAANPTYLLDIATALEASCYDASVDISIASEKPPCRRWDSPGFVDIYSCRCGTVANLINPNSTSCRIYGTKFLDSLFNGDIKPNAVGSMTAAQLCPESGAFEREVIKNRSTQEVKFKESNLFRCPQCGERRCTYQEVQRRALDEAPDYICSCIECGHHFTGH